jgi:hypothetical protein
MNNPKLETKDWPSRLALAKWHVKNCLKVAVFLGVVAFGFLLYLAIVVVISHHLPKWLP